MEGMLGNGKLAGQGDGGVRKEERRGVRGGEERNEERNTNRSMDWVTE